MNDFERQAGAEGITSADFKRAWIEMESDTADLPREALISMLALQKLRESKLAGTAEEAEKSLAQLREELTEAHNLVNLLKVDQMTKMLVRNSFVNFEYPKLEAVVFNEKKRRATDPDAILILFLDIKNLHDTNEAKGHKAGDTLVEGVSLVVEEMKNEGEVVIDDEQAVRLFEEVFREGDLTCRWGGDEFVVALPFRYADAPRKKMVRPLAEEQNTLQNEEVSLISEDVFASEEEGQPSFGELAKLVGNRLLCAMRKYNGSSLRKGDHLALHWGISVVTMGNKKSLTEAIAEADPKGKRGKRESFKFDY